MIPTITQHPPELINGRYRKRAEVKCDGNAEFAECWADTISEVEELILKFIEGSAIVKMYGKD